MVKSSVCIYLKTLTASVWSRWCALRLLILWFACFLFGIAGASASTTSPYLRTNAALAYVPVNSAGYHAPWIKRMRQKAQQASRDEEPYLANHYWRLLANAGDRDAALRLGLFYDENGHSRADAMRSVYWYRRAAEAGEMHAEHNLGVAYASGKGVGMNIRKAIAWWTRAADQGNSDSQYNLGIVYAQGEFGVTRNLKLAKYWWHEAAQHGDAMAQFNLGALYVNSQTHDYCAAMRWWHEAARQGVQQAVLALRVIKLRADYHTCQ